MDVLQPVPLVVTAEVFIDKYGPDERYDVLSYLPKVQVPLLVMIGTEEAQTMIAFEGMPLLVEQLATTQANLTFASIPGADHAYTHQRAEVWNVVRQWLERKRLLKFLSSIRAARVTPLWVTATYRLATVSLKPRMV